MSNWFPLHLHSHFSVLDGLSQPEQIAERIVECGFTGCALTDHGTIAGVPSLIDAFSDTCKCGHNKETHDDTGKGACVKQGCGCKCFAKADIKAIAGCEFYICQQAANVRESANRSLSHLCVLAKGQEGWQRLIQATSESNRAENYYYKPRLSLEELASFSGGHFIAFSGHLGSCLANCLFEDFRAAYGSETYEQARQFVRKDWEQVATAKIRQFQQLFGVENFYVEIQLVDQENIPASLVVARILRYVAKKLGVPCVATADSHYCRREDARDQRVILVTAFNTTLKEVQRRADNDEDVGLAAFFRSNNYHIPTLEEMQKLHADYPEEIENAVKIAAMCETPKIKSPPMLPSFPTPDGSSSPDFLRKLCEEGMNKKVRGRVPASELPKYEEALKKELKVLVEDFPLLSDYFLIVWDYIRYAREELGSLIGKGRGSAAGCLVSYLIDITRVDPIQFGLIFERFYNPGRNTKDHVALPDIDTDFPIGIRDLVYQYARRKYGEDKVCQMATFGRMQGRGALKDVLRANDRCSQEEMNTITSNIPEEAAISDDLQEQMEETGEQSNIRWALENNAEDLKQWCFINEQDELDGPLALDFAQAIRLEGTIRSHGKHASGVIICSKPLAETFPMMLDQETGAPMIGVDMRIAEKMGGNKFDFLVLRTLNCIMDATTVIRTGRLPSKRRKRTLEGASA